MAVDYSQCWANCLGDCAEGMSREHLVSECLYEGDINVMGFPWCKDVHKTVRIEALTGKFLCRYHNHALSEVDSAAKHTLDTLARAYDLMEVRSVIRSRSWSVKYFSTDMLLVERWCLKTLININLSNRPGLPVDAALQSNMPTEELVRVAFGLERFKPPKGLYLIAITGGNMNLADGHIQLETKSYEGKLGGAEFSLWGIPFFLNLIPESISHNQGKLIRGRMEQVFNTYDRKNRPVKSHVVTFRYPNDATNRTIQTYNVFSD